MMPDWNPEAAARKTAVECRMTLLHEAILQAGVASARAGVEMAKFGAALERANTEIERAVREDTAKKDGEK